MANYRIVSSDNHVIEPADLWTSRAGDQVQRPSATDCLRGEWRRLVALRRLQIIQCFFRDADRYEV